MFPFSKILITGGAGFVGSSLAVAIKSAWPDVACHVLDNLMRRGSELNLPRLQAHGITFHHGDIRQHEDVARAGAFDLLLDCAAEPSVTAALHAGPRKIFDINLAGSFNCFEAARQHHAAILFLSSSRVYPIPALRSLALREDETRFELEPTQPVPGVSVRGISEDCTPEGPRSFYGMTKRAGEMLLQEYMYQYDLRVLINRCGVIAGPWQMGRVDQGFMSLWMARHHFGQPLQYTGYRGSGKQVRDVLHVQDLFSLLAAQIQQADTWNGGIYNVGGGREQAVSLRELTALCESITGNRIAITGQPDTHTADVPLYISDNRRVAEAFDWQPRHTVESTARDIHAWLLQHEDQLAPLMDGRK